MNKITAISLAIILIAGSGLSFYFFLSVPQGLGAQGVSASYNSTMLIVLYANAQGWNYNTSHPNPTIYAKTHVLLEFKVIEQDNLPHTLTINPGNTENQNSAILSVNIPPIPGSVVWVNWSFGQPGNYTYWCIVHPETMVGLLVINSSGNSSAAVSSGSLVPLSSEIISAGNLYGTKFDQ